jgi:translation elongation factor EF-Tu-like GTPase
MPKKAKGKSSNKKATSRKPAKKTTRKKVIKKKVTKNLSKKLAKKILVEKTKSAVKKVVSPKSAVKEPVQPLRSIPLVEEPAPIEEAIGIVTHYYSHLGVAVIQLNKGALKTGATIHVKGHITDFTQSVESMEYEHQHINLASAGQSVGIRITDHAREHDIVFLVK